MADKKVKWLGEFEIKDMLASMKRLGKTYDDTTDKAEKDNRKLEHSADEIKEKISKLGKEIGGLKDVDAIRKKQAEMADYREELDRVLGTTKKVAKETDDAMKPKGGAGMDVLKGSFLGSFAGNIAAAGMEMIAGAVGSVKDAMIGGNAEMETYQASFETLLGSSEKANLLLNDLAVLGAKTPFEFPELAQAGRNLVAFGNEAEAVPELLRRIGDVSSGVGANVGEMAELFGKAKVSGTLYAEDINQLLGRGVPILDEFAKILGVSAVEVKKMASEGKISYDLLEQALVNMTDEGGKFSGMMEKQSATFSGLKSTFQDVLGQIGRDIGKPLFNAAKEGLIGALEWLQSPKVTKTLGEIKDGIESIVSAFDSEGDALARLGRKQQETYQKQIAYNKTRIEELDTVEDLAKEYENLADKSELTAEEQKRMEEISGNINTVYPGLIKNTDDYKTSVDKMGEASGRAALELDRLSNSNERLARAMIVSRITAARGEAKQAWDSLNDSVKEYNEEIGVSMSEATEMAAGGGLVGKIAGYLSEVFTGTDAKTADMMAKNLLSNTSTAITDLSDEMLRLSEKDATDPKINFIQAILESLTEYQQRKNEISDLQQSLKDFDSGVRPDEGGDPDIIDPAAVAEKVAKGLSIADQIASSIRLEHEKQMADFDAQLEEGFKARADLLVEEERNHLALTDRIRTLRIELIEDESRRLWEEYLYKRELIEREVEDETEKALRMEKLQRKYSKEIADARNDREKKEKSANEKAYDDFKSDYAEPVAQAATDLLMSLADDKMTAVEREQAFWDYMKSIALDTSAQILQGLIVDGIMALAGLAGLTAAQAPAAAAAGAMWAGPAALASTATFGGAAAAGAVGLSSTYALAQILGAPKFLKDGGVLNRPTFVAGEAGAEIVGSLNDLIPVFREAVLGPQQQRRTKINDRSQPRIDVGIGVDTFVRGAKSTRSKKLAGMR